MKRMLCGCLLLAVLLCACALAEGDARQVSGCDEFISLRAEPRADGERILPIPLGAEVTKLGDAPGGYAHVAYEGAEGYALAMYLTPVQTDGEAAERTPFAPEDARIGGVQLGRTRQSDILARFGEPDERSEGELEVWTYADVMFAFAKAEDADQSLLMRMRVWDAEAVGPRGIRVGMEIGEALASFPVNAPAMIEGRDFILYSQAEDAPEAPYGVLYRSIDPDETACSVELCTPSEQGMLWLSLGIEDNRVIDIDMYVTTAEGGEQQ